MFWFSSCSFRQWCSRYQKLLHFSPSGRLSHRPPCAVSLSHCCCCKHVGKKCCITNFPLVCACTCPFHFTQFVFIIITPLKGISNPDVGAKSWGFSLVFQAIPVCSPFYTDNTVKKAFLFYIAPYKAGIRLPQLTILYIIPVFLKQKRRDVYHNRVCRIKYALGRKTSRALSPLLYGGWFCPLHGAPGPHCLPNFQTFSVAVLFFWVICQLLPWWWVARIIKTPHGTTLNSPSIPFLYLLYRREGSVTSPPWPSCVKGACDVAQLLNACVRSSLCLQRFKSDWEHPLSSI